MYSHVACDVIKEQTLYLLKPSSLIWHLMPYLFLFILLLYVVSVEEHEKFLLCICLAFVCSDQCMEIISLCKKCGLSSSAFKKIIPKNTTPTFQKVGGVTQSLIFCRWHKNLSSYRVNHRTIHWFLISRSFYFSFPTVFN